MSDPMVQQDRIGMIQFQVWGDTRTELQRHARDRINEFASGETYRSKMDVTALHSNDGRVITWQGDVTAWPETAT